MSFPPTFTDRDSIPKSEARGLAMGAVIKRFKDRSASLKTFIVEPAAKKACATKTLYDIAALPDTLPYKLRLKVFNHQNNRTLIQSEDPGRYPAVRFSGCRWISCVKTGV